MESRRQNEAVALSLLLFLLRLGGGEVRGVVAPRLEGRKSSLLQSSSAGGGVQRGL